MLKSIPPELSPELLHVLRAMGHGDRLVIADANFPAASMGQRCLRLDGISATALLDAVLALLPLDDFTDDPVTSMQVVGDPTAVPEIIGEFRTIIERREPGRPMVAVERFAFYALARQAFAIVQTSEARLYGNLILTKGVVRP